MAQPALVHLQIRNPKDDETPLESASQIFASLLPAYIPLWKRPFIHASSYAFELYLYNQTIFFYVSVAAQAENFIRSLITSSYPSIAISKTTDPLPHVLEFRDTSVGEVVPTYYYLPTKTYQDFRDIDPMSSVLGFLSKRQPEERVAIQVIVTPASFAWADSTVAQSKTLIQDVTAQKYTQNPQKLLMMKKSSFQGGKAIIRILTATKTQGARSLLAQLAGTFGAFSLGEGSQYAFKRRLIFSNLVLERMKLRTTPVWERRFSILNAQELATIWHPPGFLLTGIRNIAWGKTLSGEPPENLPIAKTASDEERKDANYFATTEYKNEETIFGIKTPDRRKHIYIVGKTGAGKSTLIANMAIDDIRKDRGVAIVDPHGDLSEIILDYIPNRRVNDVVYLEPFDTERPFRLNVLENKNKQHKDLIASGIVSIFNKLYGDSWGPRLEYILRNCILTLLEIPNATLDDVLPLLSDREYRERNIPKISDEVIKNYWLREFDKMPDKLRAEAISPIQNKVGQFVSSQMIRNIIGHAKSTIDLEEIMNSGKILILNLSQGKLGEDNASLLGAMIITQVQLAAMGRSYIKEEDRKDFFLYVDEFQNFATAAFVKILSEARKYRLSLTLANQYIEQLDEEIQRAIFGNIGTLISFVVGARDAYLLSREFGEIYSENDLVALGKFETVLKLSIDSLSSSPFPAKTLPLPNVRNDNREKIARTSREKYGRPPLTGQGSYLRQQNNPQGEDVPFKEPPKLPEAPTPAHVIDAEVMEETDSPSLIKRGLGGVGEDPTMNIQSDGILKQVQDDNKEPSLSREELLSQMYGFDVPPKPAAPEAKPDSEEYSFDIEDQKPQGVPGSKNSKPRTQIPKEDFSSPRPQNRNQSPGGRKQQFGNRPPGQGKPAFNKPGVQRNAQGNFPRPPQQNKQVNQPRNQQGQQMPRPQGQAPYQPLRPAAPPQRPPNFQPKPSSRPEIGAMSPEQKDENMPKTSESDVKPRVSLEDLYGSGE